MSGQHPSQSYVMQQGYTPVDDEISLVDLWLTLSRYKYLIFASLVITALLAAFYGLSRPVKLTYSTPVRLGLLVDADGKYNLVESPTAVLEKLEKVYIPLAARALGTMNESGPTINIEVGGGGAKSSGGSDLVMLESTVTDIPEEDVARLHAEVIRQLVQDHNRFTERLESDMMAKKAALQRELDELSSDTFLLNQEKRLKMAIENKELAIEVANDPDFSQTPLLNLTHDLNKAEVSLAKTKNEGLLLENQLAQLDKQSALLQADIDELKNVVGTANQHLLKAADEAVDEPKAMTMMMIENSLQQNRSRLSSLEQKLHLDLPAKKVSLEKSIEANLKAQDVQLESIALMQRKKKQILHDQKTSRQTLATELASLNLDFERLRQEHAIKLEKLNADLQMVESRQNQIQRTEQLSVPLAEPPKQIGLLPLVLVGGVLGGMLGIMAAFFLSFLAKVREVSTLSALEPELAHEPGLKEVSRDDKDKDNPVVISAGVLR